MFASFFRSVPAFLAVRAGSSSAAVRPGLGKFDSPDNNFEEERLPAGSGTDKRAFTYFVLGGARFLYASAARLAVINVIATLSASADVLALAAVEVDLSSIAPGQNVTVKWRGKPVFIKHRTEEQIAAVANTNISELRHQQTDADRVKDPKWCVAFMQSALVSRAVTQGRIRKLYPAAQRDAGSLLMASSVVPFSRRS